MPQNHYSVQALVNLDFNLEQFRVTDLTSTQWHQPWCPGPWTVQESKPWCGTPVTISITELRPRHSAILHRPRRQIWNGKSLDNWKFREETWTQGWSNVHFSYWFPMIFCTKKWFSMVKSFVIWLWLHSSAMTFHLRYLYQNWPILLHFKHV